MTVAVTCKCNTRYDLKDEFAGKMVKCPSCGAVSRAPAPLTPTSQADPVFDRDVFLLRQKAIAIKERYSVFDEKGQQILYVVRPAHFFRNLLAAIGGIIAGVLFFIGGSTATTAASQARWTGLANILVIVTVVGAWLIFIYVAIRLSKKRHITFYRGQEGGEKILEVLQERKFEFLTTTFTIRDAKGKSLARLHKNYLSNILRRKWRLLSISGHQMLLAQEDSIILSLLRRVLGPLFGLLRTNFVFVDSQQRIVGEFQRKMTILDRYVLDMSADQNRRVDRRLALALGVILDTGERR
jgi:uncharacterized protein YxjI